MSIKEDLIGDQFVPGNIKTFLQQYNIFYYPPEEHFPSSKVWIYLNGKQFNEKTNQNEPRTIRSLCFGNMENHRNFIFNNLFYHFYWLEKQLLSQIDIGGLDIIKYRKRIIDNIIMDLRDRLLKKAIELKPMVV